MELLTVNETADILRVSTRTVYKFVKNGKIPSVRVGTAIRIPKEELEKLINKSLNKESDAK